MDRPRLSLSMSSPVPPSTPGSRLPLWGSEHGSLRGLAQYSERDMDGLPSPAGSRDWDLFAPAHWEHRSDRSDGSSVAPPLSSGSSGEGSVPTRSKTKSFFDADSAVLSPPPNPLSRNGSLRTPGVAQGPCSEFGSSHAPSWLERTDDPQRPPIIDRTLSDSPVHSPVNAAPPLPMPSKPTRLPPLPSVSTSQLASPPSGPLSSLPTPVEPPLSRGARFRNFGRKVVGATSTSAAIAAAAPQPSGPPPILSPAESETSPVERLPGGLVANDTDPDQGPKPGEVVGAYRIVRILGKGAFSRVALASRKGKEREVDPTGPPDELVALKMIARRSYEGNERMRISVVREVEVLKHIHHPSLVSLSSSFSTATHTILVLDYAPGGELFDFLADWHQEMTEPLARRMFGELCSVVGWMHSIGLVHRDIKLENILLTTRLFPCADPSRLLASLPQPILKLTDFGLSRFISPNAPLLATRCGSEAYAAPELIMGKKYDGRKTDAWAVGVVLFAIITGELPFIESMAQGEGRGRRAWLMKIAKGEYSWPSPADALADSGLHSPVSPRRLTDSAPTSNPGAARLLTASLKTLVGRLLVRDPDKRADVDEVWTMDWMHGEGRPERLSGWVSAREEGERGTVEGSWERRDEGE